MSGFLKLPLNNAGTLTGTPFTVPTSSAILHTAPPAGSGSDEIWLWAFGTGYTPSVSHTLSVVIGGQTMNVLVYGSLGLINILPGLLLSGGNTLNVLADTISTIWLIGFVNRIMQ